jgi:D-beta-D-heptose 7-phosphate kinase/D-beta-D-heptose 1-phosphate adenosyltransferase
VERISPEAPVPIVLVEQEMLKLGLAANVADNVRTLGGVPLLLGLVGKDRGAQDFRDLLKAASIDSSHLEVDPSRRTVLKERIVSERQQLLRVDYETQTELDGKLESKLLKSINHLMTEADAVILEDYAKGLLTDRLAKGIFTSARKHGKVVAVDPNSKTPLEFYRGAGVLTPNTREAEALAGIPIRDEASLIAAGTKILAGAKSQHVVITRGKDGMAIFSAGEKAVRLIPTYAREVYDVSGAGDTVISVLTLAMAAGAGIEDAALLGNLAAGVEVSKRGTATVTPDEVRTALEFFGTVKV